MLKFGFIGLNDVSESLCINLLKRANAMAYVNDNSIARVEYIGNQGGVPCELATDVVDRADIIILTHDNFVNLQATLYSILGNLNSQKIVLDLSVISPGEALEVSAMLQPTGAEYADLAILNSMEEIEAGQATIMYGGSSSVFLRIQEFIKYMGKDVIKVGEVSAALATKACYNILFAQIHNGLNEMIVFASKAGLQVNDVLTAVGASPIDNDFIKEYGPKIANNNFAVKSKIKHVHKQLEIAHGFTEKNKIPLKGLEHTKSIYDSAMDRKLASHDIAELYTIVERASHS